MLYADFIRLRQNVRFLLFRWKYAEVSKRDVPKNQWDTLADPTPELVEAHIANILAAGVDPKDVEFIANEYRNASAGKEAAE